MQLTNLGFCKHLCKDRLIQNCLEKKQCSKTHFFIVWNNPELSVYKNVENLTLQWGDQIGRSILGNSLAGRLSVSHTETHIKYRWQHSACISINWWRDEYNIDPYNWILFSHTENEMLVQGIGFSLSEILRIGKSKESQNRLAVSRKLLAEYNGEWQVMG